MPDDPKAAAQPGEEDDLLKTGDYPTVPIEGTLQGADADRATERTISVPKDLPRDRATLTVLEGFNAGQVFPLDQPVHVLGRGSEADLWVEDPALSRKHAKISRTADGHFLLEDLRSTNGTFVGARRCDKSELMTGDRIQLGPNLVLRFAVLDDREEELQRRLYESSTRDALTRAFNKKYFTERLIAEIAHARRHGTQLAVVMLDLDKFKKVNDTHGHLAGDLVLRFVAAQLMRLLRVEDVIARWGGEEFVILARSTSHANAERLALRMRAAIEAMSIPAQTGQKLQTTASFGVASLEELGPEAGATEIVALADSRLFRAKAAGRNRVNAAG